MLGSVYTELYMDHIVSSLHILKKRIQVFHMNPYLFIYFLLLVCVSLFFSHLLNFPHCFSKIIFIIPIFFKRRKLFSKTHALHRGSCLCFLSSLFILCSLECVFFFSSSLDISCVCFLSTL